MAVFTTSGSFRPGALAAACLLALGAQGGAHGTDETPDWAQTRWGPGDQLGAANHMTAARVLEAARLVTEGKVYSLGITVGAQTPAFPPRSMSVTVLQPNQSGNSGLGENAFTYNDDIFMGWLGIGPQIDGLGHSGENHVYYGGRRYDDFAPASGLTELGLDQLPGLVGRGVLLDMTRHFGTDMVAEGVPYTADDIRAAASDQGVELREGDVVLFHSNWMELLDGEDADPARFAAAEPGLGVSGAEYLAQIGVMAVGADTWGMEVVPAEVEGEAFRAHQILQAHHGIYILENMDTRELALDGVSEFLFVLGQARVQGAVQMIINPIAIR